MYSFVYSLLHSLLCSRFVLVFVCSCRLFILCAINVPLCDYTENYIFILLSISIQAIFSQAIMNSAVISILVHVFLVNIRLHLYWAYS